MKWAERRRLTYIAVIFLVLGLIAFAVFRQLTAQVATCYDNKENGNEVGVDCGGTCSQYCANELGSPKVRWVRSFDMTNTVATAAAYIEHSYPNAAAQSVGYVFRLYDERNTLITERTGTTFLGPLGRTAIVETLIPTGNRTVGRSTFSFVQPVPWEKIPSDFASIVVKTDRTQIEQFSYGQSAQSGTRLTARLENTSRYTFDTLDIVAVLYDKDDNAITTAKILLPELPALGQKTVNFTWPFTLSSPVVRTEIVVRLNPFTAREL